ERTAVEEVALACRHHARRVHMLRLAACLARLLEAEIDPFGEILDRIATDAKLDEVDGHGPSLVRWSRESTPRRLFHSPHEHSAGRHVIRPATSPSRLRKPEHDGQGARP